MLAAATPERTKAQLAYEQHLPNDLSVFAAGEVLRDLSRSWSYQASAGLRWRF